FNNFIKGKGCGLIFLLYGPLGVRKTLTAKAIIKSYKTPLYIVSLVLPYLF
ncbi:hypothetical protein V2W45_1239784, partial [Cenococcum geophilum]